MATAFIDFLGVTFRGERDDPQLLRQFAESLVRQWFGVEQVITDRSGGKFGYRHCADIEGVGLVAWGGNNATIHIEVSGGGCVQVKDWKDVADTIADYRGKITRCDVAADDFEGTRYSIDWCKAQYESDGFKPSRGVAPKARFYDDMGSGDGCTFYVGSRASGKLFRGYEKGKEQGDKESTWFRVEVEYRAVHREIPVQIITDPGAYLAGSYPCLADLVIEQRQIKTVAFTAAAALDRTLEHAKKQAGRALHALLMLNGGDIGGALARIYRPELPKRLAGYVRALLVTKPGTLDHTNAMAPAWFRDSTESERLRLSKARMAQAKWWQLDSHDFSQPAYVMPGDFTGPAYRAAAQIT
jgi:phage replication initiation protein